MAKAAITIAELALGGFGAGIELVSFTTTH
jgi:hypothetical protein